MKLANCLKRWTMRTIHAGVLAMTLLSATSIAPAQPMNAGMPAKHVTNVRVFDLPVDMPQEHRLALKEIRLYVRTPSTEWRLQESMPNHTTRFNCKINADGEYWYTLVVVDKAGRMAPPDLNKEPPSQCVVIDTTPPVIQANPASTPGGEVTLRCTLEDAHPDLKSLKATYKTPSGPIPLEAVPGQPGVFHVRSTEASQFPVVVTGRDLAGNSAAREFDLTTVVKAPSVPKTDIALTSRSDFRGGLPAPKIDTPSKIVPTAPSLPAVLPAPRGELPVAPVEVPVPIPPAKVEVNRPEFSTPADPLPIPNLNPSPNEVKPPVTPKIPVFTQNPPPSEPANTDNRGKTHQLINTEHASIEYRLDEVGPSGVGRVEVYMTTNNGQSWHRLGEDTDKRSPANIKLPGDGVYGIRIAVTNGNGFGGRAPVAGDAPHCLIEVDTTSPYVQLRSAEVLPASKEVEIRWNATDKNLGTEPVTLSYRTQADGPWQVIARGIKNDGSYRWAFPREAGSQFFFKIDVADKAGNIAHDTSRQPIVIDTTEPRATVITVTGGGTRPTVGGQ